MDTFLYHSVEDSQYDNSESGESTEDENDNSEVEESDHLQETLNTTTESNGYRTSILIPLSRYRQLLQNQKATVENDTKNHPRDVETTETMTKRYK